MEKARSDLANLDQFYTYSKCVVNYRSFHYRRRSMGVASYPICFAISHPYFTTSNSVP
ncbi:hypothetical protein GIB67_003517 [Kingdonia uniflora]|uniref:Uncharacterized protein n=1 Tax=Kingdonia uniflora TaxID=39325 RepID=A0A7J7MEP4_9MAGN|nr:hypothetical protein GIB67_003517 [Kingdonia uniflora]